MKNKMLSRRGFLAGATALAGFEIVPRFVLGGKNHTPPCEKVNIAAIGSGGRGKQNIENLSTLGHNIVALCDVDDRMVTEIYNKFPKANKYKDFRKMLEKQDRSIDAVVISTPNHTHAVAAMHTIKMGKHVYLEKPLCNTIWETRVITEAARKAGVATQMGNQGRSYLSTAMYHQWINDGAIGDVTEVHAWSNRPGGPIPFPAEVGLPKGDHPVPKELDWDLWLGPAPYRKYHPDYVPFNWRSWFDFGAGALGDMACHIIDPAFWALDLGHPETVEAVSTLVTNQGYPRSAMVTYHFPSCGDRPAVKLTWYDGGLRPRRPVELDPRRDLGSNGSLTIGTKGKILCGFPGAEGLRIIPEEKMQAYERPTKTPWRSQGHYANWIEACRGGAKANSHFDYGGPLSEIVLLGSLAIRLGRKIHWDPENMKVTNVPEAEQVIKPTYRDGWSL